MSENRTFGLDALRVAAILLVIYGHGRSIIGSSPILNKIYSIFAVTTDGVTLFFVLSGFLIGRILLRTASEKNFDSSMLFQFWIRRWFRTLPSYFLVLTILMFCYYPILNFKTLILYGTFSQNFASPHPFFFPEAWSLSVEEWFYFLIPIFLYLSLKLKYFERQKVIFFWIIFIILLTTFFRIYKIIHLEINIVDWDQNIRKIVIMRLDSLMYGMLAAYFNFYYEKKWNSLAAVCFFTGCVIMLLSEYIGWQEFYMNYLLLTISPLGVMLLLPKLSSWKVNKGRFVNTITFISLISYPMYLIHLSLIQVYILPKIMKCITPSLGNYTNCQFIIQYVIYLTLTIAIASVFTKYYEQPITALRERFDFNYLKQKIYSFKLAHGNSTNCSGQGRA